jgi:hypothetical protein
VDVRRGDLWLAALTDRPDAVALGDRRALRHGDGAEVHERHRPAVARLDGHGPAVRRHRAGERDDARRGGAHDRPEVAADVDAAMPARDERIVGVERERSEDRAVGRPGPGARGRDDGEHEKERE